MNFGEYAAWSAYRTTYPARSHSSQRAGPCRAGSRESAPSAALPAAGDALPSGAAAFPEGVAALGGERPRRPVTMNATEPAATTKYSGTSRFEVTPPASIGIRNGSATITAHASTCGHRTIASPAATTTASATTAPTAATSGWRWTMFSCGECQMSPSNRTGESTSAPSIASAWTRTDGCSMTTAASAAATTIPISGSGPPRAP